MGKVSLKVEKEITFDERSTFLVTDIVSKEEGNDDEASNEGTTKSMSFDNHWNSFLEDFLLETVSNLVSLFRDYSFFDDETSAGSDENYYGSVQKM